MMDLDQPGDPFRGSPPIGKQFLMGEVGTLWPLSSEKVAGESGAGSKETLGVASPALSCSEAKHQAEQMPFLVTRGAAGQQSLPESQRWSRTRSSSAV